MTRHGQEQAGKPADPNGNGTQQQPEPLDNAGTGNTIDGAASARLEVLRARLDSVDHELLANVGARLDICMEIGELKRDADIAMMQPSRIGVVQERARVFADSRGYSPEFFQSLYDLLIAETCRLEDLIIEAPKPDAQSPHDARTR